MPSPMIYQDLTTAALLGHAAQYHSETEIVSVSTGGEQERSSWGEVASRAQRLASAGMVQDRSGKQLRRFHVAIDGDVVGDTLTLHERFVYDDGEKQQRVWRIRRTGDNRYQGTAGDIEGVASGQAAGNAFHWRYSMNVEASGSRWLLHFDDWMFLQDGSHLFNKTEMKKFGITVATVTLFFTRTTAEERTAP